MAWQHDIIVDVDKKHFIRGPWNYDCHCEIAQLNHYSVKTFQEFKQIKQARGKADTKLDHPHYNYVINDFHKLNSNDIVDTTALDFYNTKYDNLRHMKHISVIVVGHNRTLMTIECIKSVLQHLKHPDFDIIVGSDRSDNGHVQAIDTYLKTCNVKYQILECTSFGGMMNDCCKKAFEDSRFALMIENDMILHRDLHIDNYLDTLDSTNVGNVQFKYFNTTTHKCAMNSFEHNNTAYICTLPLAQESCAVSFGQNLFSKRWFEKIGGFLANELDTDKVERDYRNKYATQLSQPFPLFNVIDANNLHQTMNDERGYFYHIGIHSQHSTAKWNKDMIPEIIRRIKDGNWTCSTSENDVTNLQAYYDGKEIDCELRWLGIVMACYDEDNAALEYPIKITTREMEYEDVEPSLSDPNQGWESDDDEEDE